MVVRRLLFAAVLAALAVTFTSERLDVTATSCPSSDLSVRGAIGDPYTREQIVGGVLPMDEEGAIFVLHGERFFHPVATAQAGLTALAIGDMPSARAAAAVLARNSVLQESARLFPYAFEYEFDNQHLEPPWYSGMAQGQALSLFARLFMETGGAGYLRLAEETSAGLRRLEVIVDGRRWANEYPIQPTNVVINGAVWAALGWWDYRRATGGSIKDLCETLDAVRDAIADDPRTVLYYDLERHFRIPPDDWYHTIHQVQLEILLDLTGDEAFVRALRVLRADSG